MPIPPPMRVTDPTVVQEADGYWYWLDETWNIGGGPYIFYKDAVEAQAKYIKYELEGVTIQDEMDEHMIKTNSAKRL